MADACPPPAGDFADALVAALDALEEGGAEFAILGGVAVNLHGIPRLTLDIDLVVRLPRIAWPHLLDLLAARGFAHQPSAAPPRTQGEILTELARDSMTQLWRGDYRLDLLQAVDPLHAEALSARIQVNALGRRIPVVRAEHLLVMKWLAARPKDLLDVEGILAEQGKELDLSIVRPWVAAIEKAGGAPRDAFEERVRRVLAGGTGPEPA